MRFFLVDAFIGEAFRSNTAAVVLLDGPADPAWMQSVAAEFKHPETAFVELGARQVPLRWFTPKTEVELCGHATLAAGHVLEGDQEFTTLSGTLTTKADNGWVYMDFPVDPLEETGEAVPRWTSPPSTSAVARSTYSCRCPTLRRSARYDRTSRHSPS